jgi:type VI protein secretion system component Hcp
MVIKDFYGKGSDLKTELTSAQFGAPRAPSSGPVRNNPDVTPSVTEINVTKDNDKDSVLLMGRALNGPPFPTVTIIFERDNGDQPKPYMELTLTDVLISTYMVSGSHGATSKPSDSLTLNFTKIEYKTTAYKENGKPDSSYDVGSAAL